MDVALPGMDGIEAVEEIMSSRPLPILVLSGQVGPGTAGAAAALAAGALDVLAKDDLDLLDPAGPAGAALRHRIKVLSRARVIRHLRARLGGVPGGSGSGPPGLSDRHLRVAWAAPRCWCGCSTALPADFPIPILVVQHIARRVHRRAGPLAGSDRRRAGWHRGSRLRRQAPGSGSRRGRTPHARRLGPAGTRPAHRRRDITGRRVTSCSPASPRRPGGRVSPSC